MGLWYRISETENKMKKKKILIIALVLGVLLGAGAFVLVDYFYGIYSEIIVEAGCNVTAKDYLKYEKGEAFFTADTYFDCNVPGDYQVRVKSGIFTYKGMLHVKDTIPPVAKTKDLVIGFGETVTADQFVSDIVDATAVTIAFSNAPDFQTAGNKQVEICLTDLGQNTTYLNAVLLISPVVSEITVEAGSDFPKAEDFLIAECEASLLTKEASVSMDVPGDYPVEIEISGNVFSSVLKVADTTAPTLVLSEQNIYQGVAILAEAFVEEATDVSEIVSYDFVTEPDFMVPGETSVEIIATDAFGNAAVENTILTIIEDNEAPVFTGLADKLIFIGDSYSYRSGVSVKDNSGEELAFEIDASGVNLATEGEYTVTYKASDYAGNETSKTIVLTVKNHEYSLEEVNELADAVLAKIIKDGMSDYDKCCAIYKWVRQNIGYISHSDKGDYLKSAYEGFVKKQGDCYTYFSVSKVLLTQAGIQNRDIEKIPAKTRHYWNLVNIGDGWYHFDTTPRSAGGEFCMLTNDQMLAYSQKHYGSHNYDPAVYSDVVWGTMEYHAFDANYTKKKEESSEQPAPTEQPAPEGNTGGTEVTP